MLQCKSGRSGERLANRGVVETAGKGKTMFGKNIGETSQDLLLQWCLFHIFIAQHARIWKHTPGDTEIGVTGDDPEFWSEKNGWDRVVKNAGLFPWGQKNRPL